MISFRQEKIVGETTELTEVEVVFEAEDSASALHAKHRVVDLLCGLLTAKHDASQEWSSIGEQVSLINKIQA